jgi:hypothetical protein
MIDAIKIIQNYCVFVFCPSFGILDTKTKKKLGGL